MFGYIVKKILYIYASICNFIKLIRVMLFRVKKIYALEHNKKNNLYIRYIILKCLRMFNNTPVIGILTSCMYRLIDRKYKIVKVEIENIDVDRNIILDNKLLSEVCEIVNNFKFDINDKIMHHKTIITKISMNDNSIKKLIENYADKPKQFSNTVRNIFLIKSIKYDENDIMTITFLKMCRRNIVKYKICDVVDMHVSDLYKITEQKEQKEQKE